MKKNQSNNNLIKRLRIWALVVALILLIPLLGQVPWTLMDFIFAGVVLFGLAATYEVVTQYMTKRTHRIVTGVVVFTVLTLIWAWAVAYLSALSLSFSFVVTLLITNIRYFLD